MATYHIEGQANKNNDSFQGQITGEQVNPKDKHMISVYLGIYPTLSQEYFETCKQFRAKVNNKEGCDKILSFNQMKQEKTMEKEIYLLSFHTLCFANVNKPNKEEFIDFL